LSAERLITAPEALTRAVFPTFTVPAAATVEAPADAEAPDLDPLAERARAAAVAAGHAEGRAAAAAEWSGRLAAAAGALEAAAREVTACRATLAAELEAGLPDLVLLLAGKIVHRELGREDTPVGPVVRYLTRQCLGDAGPVVVRLAPDAVEALDAWRRSDEAAAALRALRIEADPALGPGDWVVETGAGFLDGRLASQLDAAWRCLGEPGP
jgi:flagellar assembly protein FliH